MCVWSRKSDGMPPPCITSKVPHSASAAQTRTFSLHPLRSPPRPSSWCFPHNAFPLAVRSALGFNEVRGKQYSDFEFLRKKLLLKQLPVPIPDLPSKKPAGDKKQVCPNACLHGEDVASPAPLATSMERIQCQHCLR